MEANMVQWLDAMSSRVFGLSVALLLAMNAVGVVIVALKRDRAMVNRWTPRFLVANLMLLGAGLGVPAMTAVAKVAVRTIAPMMDQSLPASLSAKRDDDRESVLPAEGSRVRY